jgi:hypothetical protein
MKNTLRKFYKKFISFKIIKNNQLIKSGVMKFGIKEQLVYRTLF